MCSTRCPSCTRKDTTYTNGDRSEHPKLSRFSVGTETALCHTQTSRTLHTNRQTLPDVGTPQILTNLLQFLCVHTQVLKDVPKCTHRSFSTDQNETKQNKILSFLAHTGEGPYIPATQTRGTKLLRTLGTCARPSCSGFLKALLCSLCLTLRWPNWAHKNHSFPTFPGRQGSILRAWRGAGRGGDRRRGEPQVPEVG
jgi:hypothetical protein